MNISIIEFKRRVRKLNHPRCYKVKNSLGVYDGYKWIRKNKWLDIGRRITEHEFYSIIRKMNLLLSEELINNGEIKLPQRMGTIELRKYETNITIDKKGKIHNNLPIDWEKTIELWYEDEESYKKRTLVKMEEKEVFKIYYNKSIANYNNRAFYDFEFNKELKTLLKQRIKENKIDAPLLRKKEIW